MYSNLVMGIQKGSWFIQHQNRRILRQGGGNHYPLALSTTKSRHFTQAKGVAVGNSERIFYGVLILRLPL